jgi:uncharacterized protein (TIGR02246 family)
MFYLLLAIENINIDLMKKNDENEIRLLYQRLIVSWNRHNATDFASLFCEDGNTIGFDGSQMNGPKQIKDELAGIFSNHKVASYVGIVQEVRTLAENIFLLRAVAGMVPPGKTAIMPERNAIQSLIVTKNQDEYCIALYQNTPAAFDGRPALSKQLTEELQVVFDSGQITA